MSKPTMWMPLYIGDYLADTMRLTTLQHGAYFLLMMEYWTQGPLPNDEGALAAIAKLDRPTWKKDVWPALQRFFAEADGGMLTQKRLEAERDKARQLSDKRRAAVAARRDRQDDGNDPPPGSKRKQPDPKPTYKPSTIVDTNVGSIVDTNGPTNEVTNGKQKPYKQPYTRASCPIASPSPSQLEGSSLRSEPNLKALAASGTNPAQARDDVPDWQALGNAVLEAAGYDPARSLVTTGEVRQWLYDALRAGHASADCWEIITGAVRRVAERERGKGRPLPANLKYFRGAVAEAIAATPCVEAERQLAAYQAHSEAEIKAGRRPVSWVEFQRIEVAA